MKMIDKHFPLYWSMFEAFLEDKCLDVSANASMFVSWCENELYECPNCSLPILKEKINYDDFNTDLVCEECIENGYYE